MPSFFYKAKKESAETVTGYVSADNREQAVELVNQLGFLPVEVEEATVNGALVKKARQKKIKLKELYLFTRQLSNLLKSGLPLLKALEAIQKQIGNQTFSAIVEAVTVEVRNGASFSSALADYPNVFSPLYIAMIAAGEESGKIKQMLQSLAVYQKKQLDIMSKVRSALAYPTLMAFVGLATIIFILSYVMPKISVLFDGLNTDLPLPTVIVLAMSKFVKSFWYWGAGLICFGVILGRYLKQLSWIKASWESFLISTPVIRSFVTKIEFERFCRTLQLLLMSGIPVIKSIQIAIPTLNNRMIRYDLRRCLEELTSGGTFGHALMQSKYVPEFIGQIIAVGEESSSLDEALGDIADSYEQEIDETTKSLTALLEPLMILTVGLTIGFIVFAMLMPIFQMDILAQ